MAFASRLINLVSEFDDNISQDSGESILEHIQEDYDRGRAQAKMDLETGLRKIYVQTRGAWGNFLFDLMQERYGIFVEHANDMTTESQLSYEGGYNSVLTDYVESSNGEHTMTRIWDEVDAFRNDQYQNFLKSEQDATE